MTQLPRNHAPSSLAEHIAIRGNTCPIPATHDRLFETHHWWHELARWYHEPEPFRYRLGAFIQAARNVTFVLQSEKAVFADFGWYEEWVRTAREDPILQWLNSARVSFVHREALAPYSWLEMHCLDDPENPHGTDEDPLLMKVNPFYCTHYYMLQGPQTDHAHKYIRYWSMDGLDGRELLEGCADIYDCLDYIVVEAHRQLGGGMLSNRQEGSTRALPCMENLERFCIAQTEVIDGREIWRGEQAEVNHD